jgi:ABC-type multidrug transport system ATPase subunit
MHFILAWGLQLDAETQFAVEAVKVSKLYDTFAALRHATCSFATGGLHLILGENGAGKSTLLRIIAGLSTPNSGTVRVLNRNPGAARGVAYMSHAPMLYDEMTAMENLSYFAALYVEPNSCGCSISPEMALRAVGLDPHLSRPVGNLSQGMRQRASMARALMADPVLLLLDEPFSNMDVEGAQQMLDLLLDFKTWPSPLGTRTILLTTHQADLVLPVADTVTRIHRGAVVDAA